MKVCSILSLIPKLFIVIALLTLGISNYREAQSSLNPDLKYIQTFLLTKGISLDTTHLRYFHIFLAYILMFCSTLGLWCSNCKYSRSLILFALVALNISLIVGRASYYRDHIFTFVQSGDVSKLLNLDILKGNKPRLVQFYTFVASVLLEF